MGTSPTYTTIFGTEEHLGYSFLSTEAVHFKFQGTLRPLSSSGQQGGETFVRLVAVFLAGDRQHFVCIASSSARSRAPT